MKLKSRPVPTMKAFIRAPKAYEMKNEKVFHPTVFPSVEKCCDKVYEIKNPEKSISSDEVPSVEKKSISSAEVSKC